MLARQILLQALVMPPRGGRAGHANGTRRPVDLTGCVSIPEKNDLTTLVAAITEKMHNDISNIFDSPPVSPVAQEVSQHHWLSLPLAHRRAKENEPPSSRTYQQAGSSSKSYNKAHSSIENEEKESITPQLRELKKESLAFFRKWQTTILTRLRDTSVADPNVAQGDARGPGRGGIRGAFRGRGSERGGRGGSMNRAGLTLATGKLKNNSSLCPSDEEQIYRTSKNPDAAPRRYFGEALPSYPQYFMEPPTREEEAAVSPRLPCMHVDVGIHSQHIPSLAKLSLEPQPAIEFLLFRGSEDGRGLGSGCLRHVP